MTAAKTFRNSVRSDLRHLASRLFPNKRSPLTGLQFDSATDYYKEVIHTGAGTDALGYEFTNSNAPVNNTL